jgi:hypothetical protein
MAFVYKSKTAGIFFAPEGVEDKLVLSVLNYLGAHYLVFCLFLFWCEAPEHICNLQYSDSEQLEIGRIYLQSHIFSAC